MPKRAADDGEASATAKKKAKPAVDAPEPSLDGKLSQDADGKSYLDLGSLKRASVTIFKGKAQLDIREYYTEKSSGDIKPGKKGVTLNPAQWAALTAAIPALTEKLEAAKAEEVEEASKSKKTTKAKKSEKPAKKKKKEESEEEASEED